MSAIKSDDRYEQELRFEIRVCVLNACKKEGVTGTQITDENRTKLGRVVEDAVAQALTNLWERYEKHGDNKGLSVLKDLIERMFGESKRKEELH